MSACQHKSTTFSRDVCPEPCGVMHTWCEDCGVPVDNCPNWIGVAQTTEDWTPEQAQAAQAELDELERTDPDVAAAAASYDRMVERVTGKAWFGNGRQTDEQRTATPAERAAADELTRELRELQNACGQPTEADWDTAEGCIERATQGNPWSEVIARALAAERAAIHARYEAVATRLENDSRNYDDLCCAVESNALAGAVRDIRQVAAQ